MTAEIAVLNRNAVALAADSAVTLQLPEGPKIYHTNKLFALSKYQPIGIMIYGSADFMGLPWETIIKRYRAQLGRASFKALESYGDSFLRYIESEKEFRSPKSQAEFCHQFTHSWLHKFKLRLRRLLKKLEENGKAITDGFVRSTARAFFNVHVEQLESRRRLPRFSRIGPGVISSRYRRAIRDAIQSELQRFPRFASVREIGRAIALAAVSEGYWSQESGIVIAGFGRLQTMPSLRCYTLDGMLANRLRVEVAEGKASDVTGENGAIVTAFAQSEMAALFMNGIDTEFLEYIMGFIGKSFLDGYPAAVRKLLAKHMAPKPLAKVTRGLRDIGKKLSAELESSAREYCRDNHWSPIIEIVRHLPKEELAAMAEALVNLTSFKRHVTRQAETVGGPIGVAIISRGDGLIWIKRKHYFKPELNQHFLANYYNDCKEAQVPYEKATRFL